ncbi:protein of unknown function [Candidatus Nitrosocosmicus franklandus]|uniref:Uncharacterized protein n=1 Tax=Candidatus Nitrosocosmicus franklandianus TaxID=1798806 RepID=A0A484IKF3_9ARCH|nr:protein of unknown function [Candidatus Nitrosocosmicus franklandus]
MFSEIIELYYLSFFSDVDIYTTSSFSVDVFYVLKLHNFLKNSALKMNNK